MKIAIQGHSTRGKEVIQILESLGGINKYVFSGKNQKGYYFITEKNIIDVSYLTFFTRPDNFYTLEEFETEFPFKIGDIVLLKGVNRPYEIMALEEYMNKLCYKLDNGLHCEPKTLTTYEKMKKERNITLTLDKAKEWYKKGGELREVALQAYSEKELNPLPRSWEEFYKQGNPIASWRYDAPLKYQALFKLEQLRNCWRQGWKPKTHESVYTIKFSVAGLRVYQFNSREFLSFPTREMAEEFLNCFEDLIKQAGDLI